MINLEVFEKELEKMKQDPRLLEMLQYRQHGSCNTYQHSVYVAEYARNIAKFLHINVSEAELARGAMLHDFYLYEIKTCGLSAWRHGTGHAQRALENAEAEFDLTDRERDIIYSHMWPLNLTHIPHCRESVLVSTADKATACVERLRQWKGFAMKPIHYLLGAEG